MRVARLFPLLLLTGGTATVLPAQIPTRRAPTTTVNATRMLVGNPHSFTTQDSAPGVAIGDGLRTRMDKLVGSQFRVLSRNDMNEALKQFGYPGDAILAPLALRSLAQSLNARVMVVTSLTHDQGGRFGATARLAGLNDEAGMVVSLTQAPGQSMTDFGTKVAEGFTGALKVWDEAKSCVDQSKNAPAKAAEAARKALQQVPDHGLANYCLGMLALGRGSRADSAEAMKYFGTAVKGDPLSLNAWTQLAAGYEIAGDTTKTVDALLQMLRIAPTNQPLRDLVFKKLLAYGKPELAEQVADEGLKLDPSNPDLYDLRANARIFRENYNGALDDLEQIAALDSTRADSTFFVKYLVTAGASEQLDTARIVKYASLAVRKFPDNQTLLKQAIGAYSQVGRSDSMLVGLQKLAQVDAPSAVGFALQEAKNRQDAKDFAGSDPFVALAAKYGDEQAKDGAAAFMLQGVSPMLQQQPPNWQAIADSTKAIIALAAPAGRIAPIAQYYRGLALVNVIVTRDGEAEKQKSCDLARQVETLTPEAEAALEAARAYTESPQGASQEKTRQSLVGYVTGLKARTASMIKVYCK